MNKLGQFGIVLSVLLIGHLVQTYFKLPIPSSVIGMIVLLVLLIFKVIQLSWVEAIGKVLMDNLSLLFIPAGVGIMNELHMFENKIIPIVITISVTTILVMLVTGYTVQALMGSKRR